MKWKCEVEAGVERTQKEESSRSEVTTRPSEVRSDDLLAVIQDLVREIDAVMSSKGVHTRLCDTNIAWHARRVREALTTNSAMRINEAAKAGEGEE